MKRSLSEILSQIRSHGFTKEFKDFEFETKFDVARGVGLGAMALLAKVEKCFVGHPHFILCKVRGGDKLVAKVVFFAKKNMEYSFFKYRGARMLKVKKHKIIKGIPFSIFKNIEGLLIDKKDFEKKLNLLKRRFRKHKYSLVDINKTFKKLGLSKSNSVGKMTKVRVKDFVFDARDGRIYAVAISFCKSGGRTQKQLEVEYSGYLGGVGNFKKGNEKEIISKTLELSRHIYKRLSGIFRPSVERKFEFVNKSRSEK